MRTPREWAEYYSTSPVHKAEDVIEMAQKEAYNQAIEDAVENAEIKWNSTNVNRIHTEGVDKESILKLLKK